MCLALGLAQVAMLGATLWTKGYEYVNVDNLLEHSTQFLWLILIPASLGALCLMLSVIPRTVAINLIVLLVFLALVEGAAWQLKPEPEAEGQPQPVPTQAGAAPLATGGWSAFYRRDPVLNHVLAPKTRARHEAFLAGRKIYDVVYETDDRGRRKTPTSTSRRRPRFVLFFGDSNTFGYGLSQRETLPFYVGELAPDYEPYNYGVPGYGPAHMLEVAKRRRLEEEVAQGDGMAVFFMISGHLARVVGGSEMLQYGRDYPYYAIGREGALVARGTFARDRPLTTLGYYLWSRSHLMQWFEVSVPLQYSAADYELTAKIFAASVSALRQRFKLRDLYVVLGQAYDDRETEILSKARVALGRQGVRCLDYTALFNPSETPYHLADYHNSARANEVIARQLVADSGIGASRDTP